MVTVTTTQRTADTRQRHPQIRILREGENGYKNLTLCITLASVRPAWGLAFAIGPNQFERNGGIRPWRENTRRRRSRPSNIGLRPLGNEGRGSGMVREGEFTDYVVSVENIICQIRITGVTEVKQTRLTATSFPLNPPPCDELSFLP